MKQWLGIFAISLSLAVPQGNLWAQAEGSHTSSPNQRAQVALKGLDPIELAKGKEVPGKAQWAATHEGFRYLFSSASNLEKFRSNPEKFAVQEHGNCPVAKVMMGKSVKGKPDLFATCQGKIYLFLEPKAKEMFLKNPAKFVEPSAESSTPREGSDY